MLRLWAPLAIAGIVTAIYLTSGLEFADKALLDLRYRLVQHDAPRDLVLVEINESSLQEIGVWPWPRRLHAQLLDRLRLAGPRRVALDIDFSSRSNPKDDQLLSQALARFQSPVILPVFRQRENAGSGRSRILESHPLPSFRPNAELAAFNIRPDADGRTRRLFSRESWQGRIMPHVAAFLAGVHGSAPHSYFINFGIDPAAIPRISYADVLAGRFDPSFFAGRHVLVGATAIQLGDMVAVPVYRAMPGITLQALGYHSLVKGLALTRVNPTLTVIAIFLVAAAMRFGFRMQSWRRDLAITTIAAAVIANGAAFAYASFGLIVDIAALLLVVATSYMARLATRINRQDLLIVGQKIAIKRHEVQMRLLVENSFDGIFTLDEAGNILTLNSAGEAMLGWSRSDAVGQPISHVLGIGEGRNGATLPKLFRETSTVNIVVQNRSGANLVLDLSVSRLRTEGLFNILCIARDITEQVKSREELVLAKDSAQASDRTKTAFLHNMSHELRTPLNAIIGFSEVISSEVYGPLGHENYRSYLEDISYSGHQLLDVINDILAVTQIESGNLQFHEEQFDLAKELVDMTNRAKSAAEEAGLSLVCRTEVETMPLMADPPIVRRMINNMISNAIKFTPEGGEVHIQGLKLPDGAIAVTVTDTGIGMTEDEVKLALEPFSQVDNRLERSEEGLGLGLFLTLKFAELHGGTLTINSHPGLGTTAAITFPAERSIPQSAPLGAAASGNPAA